MDPKIAAAQDRVLAVFAREAAHFALAGGTALERYYLHHRFSWDLDFFSVQYPLSEIERLTAAFKKQVDKRLKLESEFLSGGHAKVRFYSMPVLGASRPLKIDFVEDVLLAKPVIRKVKGVRVYGPEAIYLQKLAAIAGTRPEVDEAGRVIHEGRNEARDVFDLYMLSRKIMPLHVFLKGVSPNYQKGMIHWFRTFSRHDLKLAVLDIERYDDGFDSREMIAHLEKEIDLFARGVAEA